MGPRMRAPSALLVALALVNLGPSTLARAAPPAEASAPDTSSPDTSAPDEATKLERAKDFVSRGQSKFNIADYNGAIELWEQAYELLPEAARGQIEAALGNAHLEAYTIDLDRRHLRKAEVLFNNQVALLDPEDEETRAELDAQLARIAAERERIQMREQQLAARDQRARDQATREQVAREQAEIDEAGVADTRARDLQTEQDGRLTRRRVIVGSALLGIGGAALGVMAAGLALGAGVEGKGAELATDPTTEPALLQELRDDGYRYNRLAWTMGVVGSTLVISGASALVIGLIQRARGRRSAARERAGLARLTLRF